VPCLARAEELLRGGTNSEIIKIITENDEDEWVLGGESGRTQEEDEVRDIEPNNEDDDDDDDSGDIPDMETFDEPQDPVSPLFRFFFSPSFCRLACAGSSHCGQYCKDAHIRPLDHLRQVLSNTARVVVWLRREQTSVETCRSIPRHQSGPCSSHSHH
jgi:hypothetical protein